MGLEEEVESELCCGAVTPPIELELCTVNGAAYVTWYWAELEVGAPTEPELCCAPNAYWVELDPLY